MTISRALSCFSASILLHSTGLAQQLATVDYSAAPGERNIIDSSATPVPDGNIAAIGYFTPGFNVANNANNYTALQSAWHLYGETTIKHLPTPTGEPGRFAGVASQSDPNSIGQQIYLWITETNLAGSVTQYGLFSSTAGGWSFPDPGATPPGNSTTVNSSQVDSFLFGNSVSGTPGSLELANVVTVPEPSISSLLALGGLCGALWLRSKR